MRRCLPLLCLVLAAEPAAADLRADWSACQQNELAEFSRTREVRQDAAHQYCYGLGYAFGGASLRLGQRLFREGTLLADMTFRLAVIDRDGRPARLPGDIRDALSPHVQAI